MSLRHHLIFDRAVMAQTFCAVIGRCPKEKRWRIWLRHLDFPDGAPMAQWHTKQRRGGHAPIHRAQISRQPDMYCRDVLPRCFLTLELIFDPRGGRAAQRYANTARIAHGHTKHLNP
jgi:hypothetical protein